MTMTATTFELQLPPPATDAASPLSQLKRLLAQLVYDFIKED